MTGAESERTTRQIRVLIADDHPVVRTGLASVLSQESDVEVIGEAENGQRAVELSTIFKPDVILMDLRMPVMDGVRAIEAIVSENPSARILALSTYEGDGDIRRALDAGARGYLLKDMLLAELVNAVRAVHAGRTVLPAPVAEQLAGHAANTLLTPRETEILEFVARGLSNKQIARAIGRSNETVKLHLKNIFVKLDVADRTKAVTVALSRGLLRTL